MEKPKYSCFVLTTLVCLLQVIVCSAFQMKKWISICHSWFACTSIWGRLPKCCILIWWKGWFCTYIYIRYLPVEITSSEMVTYKSLLFIYIDILLFYVRLYNYCIIYSISIYWLSFPTGSYKYIVVICLFLSDVGKVWRFPYRQHGC